MSCISFTGTSSEEFAVPPVAVIIFNRPDLTKQLINALRLVKPPRLFVIADGPRSEEERALCEAARTVFLNGIDWECEVHKNFSEKNLGSCMRPFSGITWLFTHVTEAIILEDDCIPHPSFFRFCAELLTRYRKEEKVFSIAGAYHVRPSPQLPYSYWFSPLTSTWGFATWKRSWEKVSLTLPQWGELRSTRWLTQAIGDNQIADIYRRKFDKLYFDAYRGRAGWDYAYLYAMLRHNALDLRPSVNMVSNIGFRSDATNTKEPTPWADLPALEITFPLTHPPVISPSLELELLLFRQTDPNFRSLSRRLIKRLPLAGSVLQAGKHKLRTARKFLARAKETIAWAAKLPSFVSDYHFRLSDFLVRICEPLFRGSVVIKEISQNDATDVLRIRDIEFHWPRGQARKELGGLWREVFHRPWRNPHAYEAGEVSIRPGDTVIDAGASEGFFTRRALNKGARVIAVEPLKILEVCLKKTFAREVSDGTIRIARVLLGNANRTAGIKPNPQMISASAQTDDPDSEQVAMVTLDRWLQDNHISRVDFIKMDIEGAEVDAIKGASEVLRRDKPKLAIAVYHEYENAKIIRDYLRSIRPDYRIRFRGIYDYGGIKPRPYMLHAY